MMESWRRSVAIWVNEAKRILQRYELPTEWPELEEKRACWATPDELLNFAVQVIGSAFFLEKEIERNRASHAVDRYHSLTDAYLCMSTLDSVPKLQSGPLLDDRLAKNLRIGTDMAERVRSSKATPEQLKADLDQYLLVDYPRHGITTARSEVGLKYGFKSGRQVAEITKWYDPRK